MLIKRTEALIEPISHPEIQITIWKNHSQSEFESDMAAPHLSDLKWIYFNSDEVMYFSVMKNLNWNESFAKHPERYEQYLQEWLS